MPSKYIMKVKKSSVAPAKLVPRESKKVYILWCDDGWTYIPLLKLRRKFTESSDSMLEYIEEHWDYSVPAKVLYEEVVLWTLYSSKPRVWTEHGKAEDPKGFLDCFEEIA